MSRTETLFRALRATGSAAILGRTYFTHVTAALALFHAEIIAATIRAWIRIDFVTAPCAAFIDAAPLIADFVVPTAATRPSASVASARPPLAVRRAALVVVATVCFRTGAAGACASIAPAYATFTIANAAGVINTLIRLRAVATHLAACIGSALNVPTAWVAARLADELEARLPACTLAGSSLHEHGVGIRAVGAAELDLRVWFIGVDDIAATLMSCEQSDEANKGEFAARPGGASELPHAIRVTWKGSELLLSPSAVTPV